LYTTATSYPWYHTLQPITLSLPNRLFENDPSMSSAENYNFRYRYAVHRAGVFYRFENTFDNFNEDIDGGDDDDVAMDIGIDGDDAAKKSNMSVSYHQVPLRLLSNRESYIVNDVLGKTGGPPDIDHNRLVHNGNGANGGSKEERTPSVGTLHSRNSSFGKSNNSFASLASKGSGAALNAVGGTGATTARKKAVGFAPAPPPYHRPKAAAAVQAVHLNSTDGLVVVSAFLPVVLHRSETAQWSADWDYEALLSMQTHLRVTRIGVVKWRGWHGNSGKDGSPRGGVPFEERHIVEECLRPFNCVPVWMDTSLFGEM
jgi:hypothetical protein